MSSSLARNTAAGGVTLLVWDSETQMYTSELNYTGDSDPDGLMAGFGAEPGTWFDMSAFATSDKVLKNGDAFWIVSSAPAAKVTISGEVPTNALEIAIKPGFNMIANPYPQAIAINDLFTVTGLTGLDWTFSTTTGDTMIVWDPETQTYNLELNYTGDSDPDGLMATFGAEPGTWFDMSAFGTATTEIQPGQAFWIISSGTGTLTFK